MHRPRARFPWHPPLRLSLRARVSAAGLPGTWGFGLWNDPFSLSLGLGGTARWSPALPNAAWFFHASPPNYLALHDAHPAQGFLMATFSSPRIPAPALAPGLPALPLLLWPPTRRLVRGLARRLIRDDAASLPSEPTSWSHYSLEWFGHVVCFFVNGVAVSQTPIAPKGPLGLVLWIDNQFAAFPPQGPAGTGGLASAEAGWLEVAEVDLEQLPVRGAG